MGALPSEPGFQTRTEPQIVSQTPKLVLDKNFTDKSIADPNPIDVFKSVKSMAFSANGENTFHTDDQNGLSQYRTIGHNRIQEVP